MNKDDGQRVADVAAIGAFFGLSLFRSAAGVCRDFSVWAGSNTLLRHEAFFHQ